MRAPKLRGCLASLVFLLVLCVVLAYGVAAIIAPWSFHIAGHWTPLLSWSGTGMLLTKGGSYPLYVFFFPSPHFSRLRLDGLRPTGGVEGTGSICTSRGVTQLLELTGTIYNGWRSTAGSLMQFRLLEFRILKNTGPRRGFFDLYGRWRGQELVMDTRGEVGSPFLSGLKIDHASVTLNGHSYSDFQAACASGSP